MSERPESHYQHRRDNPQKPFVAKEDGIWWARVIDMDDEYHSKINWSLPEAVTKAYEYAFMVEKQRMIQALAASPSKAVGP